MRTEHGPRSSRHWLGVALVVCGALGFALSVIFAVLVYRSGGDAPTFIMTRSIGFTLILFLVLRATRRPVMLPPAERYKSILVGVLFSVQSFCYYKGISLIPVSIAAIVEYTYPLQIALFMRLVYREPLTLAKLASLIAAFIGVTLALRVPAGGPIEPSGVAYIVLASMMIAAMILISNRIMGTVDSRRVTLHMAATVAVLYLVLFQATDLAPAWPQTGVGWLLLLGAPLVYLVGMLGFFTGLSMIGPTRTAMLANTEPVITLALAVPILGESLSPTQLLGAALVIGAIFAMQVFKTRRKTGAQPL